MLPLVEPQLWPLSFSLPNFIIFQILLTSDVKKGPGSWVGTSFLLLPDIRNFGDLGYQPFPVRKVWCHPLWYCPVPVYVGSLVTNQYLSWPVGTLALQSHAECRQWVWNCHWDATFLFFLCWCLESQSSLKGQEVFWPRVDPLGPCTRIFMLTELESPGEKWFVVLMRM